MYLLEILFENSTYNGDGAYRFRKIRNSRSIAKWTRLPENKAGRELLLLAAVALGGEKYINAAPVSVERRENSPLPLRIGCILARHYPLDTLSRASPELAGGVEVDAGGRVVPLGSNDLSTFQLRVPARKLAVGKRFSAYFLLGYGGGYRPKPRRQDLGFTDPLHRLTRFHSLLMSDAPLTNPVDFLERLRYKGLTCGRTPPKHTLHALCTHLSKKLYIKTEPWSDVSTDLDDAWDALLPWQKRAALPVLDMARHMMDAFPNSGNPLEMPGVILLDRPETFCIRGRFSDYMALLDTLFPCIQFIMSASDTCLKSLPASFWKSRLTLPERKKLHAAPVPHHLSRDTVLLIDVDGRLPNLALMKLSAHYRSRGRTVFLGRRDCFLAEPDKVYASTLFYSPPSEKRNQRLRDYYGDKLTLGGTGEDLGVRLPDEVEALPPDYKLYPELGDRAIGFITRGCPFACPFCVVPRKEGPPRQVSDLDTLLEGGRRSKLILLDDNILSHPDADRFLLEMVQRGIMVNFTQTLDLRLVTRERAALIRGIRCSNTRFTRSNFHFSLNDNRNLDLVARKYRLFDFNSRDNVAFICMYGYNTTLEEDVERFSFLRSLPGAYVFMQKYQPVYGGPSPDMENFFGAEPDRLIDKLIRIVFTQNMKSMEVYYKWVSRRYARTYGKLHMGLVDTIFRYNRRHKKGEYIATLAGTKKGTF